VIPRKTSRGRPDLRFSSWPLLSHVFFSSSAITFLPLELSDFTLDDEYRFVLLLQWGGGDEVVEEVWSV